VASRRFQFILCPKHAPPLWRVRACGYLAHQPASPPPRRSQLAIDATIVSPLTRLGVQLLRLLARHKAATVPAASRPAATTAWVARWSVAARRACAASLLELPPAEAISDGPVPEPHEVLADARWD